MVGGLELAAGSRVEPVVEEEIPYFGWRILLIFMAVALVAAGFMRLTPDSRAPAYLGLGMRRAGFSLSLSPSLSLSLSLFETWWGLY